MMSKPILSLCMIVKDEEEYLGECLNSVKEICDEIIIVDTGSKDKTAQIAERFGAKIFNFSWIDDFAAARNESLRHAKGDWILVLDADEIISERDCKHIKELIDNPENARVDAFFLDQTNYTDNMNYTGWQAADPQDAFAKNSKGFFLNPMVRLFRNKMKENSKTGTIIFEHRIHESVEPSIYRQNGKVKKTNIRMHHYGFAKSEEQMNKKRDKYLQIGLKQIEATPDNSKPYIEVGLVYYFKNEYEKAEEYMLKAAELDAKFRSPYTSLGKIYEKMGRIDKAIEAYRKAIQIIAQTDGSNPNPFLNLGILLAKTRKGTEAQQIFEDGIQNSPNETKLYNNLSNIYISQGQIREAVATLNRSIQVNQNNPHAYFNLATIYARSTNQDHQKQHEHLQKAAELANKTLAFGFKRELVSALLAQIEYRKGNLDGAVDILERIVDLNVTQISRQTVNNAITLAQLKSKQGNKDEALQMIDKLESKTTNEPLKHKLKQLKSTI